MKNKTIALVLMGMCLLLAAVAIAVGIWSWGGRSPDRSAAGSDQFQLQDDPEALNADDKAQSAAPPWTGPLVSEQAEPAPADYFDDAAFLGNSLVDGLDLNDYGSLLSNADFYVSDGLTVQSCAEQVAKMADTVYGKIYVGLGTNEMGSEQDTLRQAFNRLIDQLEQNNPGCVIYLMSVPPVSAYKSSTDSNRTRTRVLTVNAMLQEIATERQVWYLDIYSGLCDEEGYLPSEVTTDGIHFTPGHYDSWYECLQNYYVPIEPAK